MTRGHEIGLVLLGALIVDSQKFVRSNVAVVTRKTDYRDLVLMKTHPHFDSEAISGECLVLIADCDFDVEWDTGRLVGRAMVADFCRSLVSVDASVSVCSHKDSRQ